MKETAANPKMHRVRAFEKRNARLNTVAKKTVLDAPRNFHRCVNAKKKRLRTAVFAIDLYRWVNGLRTGPPPTTPTTTATTTTTLKFPRP